MKCERCHGETIYAGLCSACEVRYYRVLKRLQNAYEIARTQREQDGYRELARLYVLIWGTLSVDNPAFSLGEFSPQEKSVWRRGD